MPTYVYRDGEVVLKTAVNGPLKRGPNVLGDLPGYLSPVTGEFVEGRRDRREDMARNQCREVDPSEKLTVARMRNE